MTGTSCKPPIAGSLRRNSRLSVNSINFPTNTS